MHNRLCNKKMATWCSTQFVFLSHTDYNWKNITCTQSIVAYRLVYYQTWQWRQQVYFDIGTLLQDYTASSQSRRQQSPQKLCIRTYQD